MIWIVKIFTRFIPEPLRIWALVIIAGLLIGVGSVGGWKARDYLADRKELAALKTQLKEARAESADWERQAAAYQSNLAAKAEEAAQRQKERDESRAKATELAAQVQRLKTRLTRMEIQDVTDTGECMCERTDPCHWLLINAAINGTEVPSQCASSVPEEVKGKLLPDARVDR